MLHIGHIFFFDGGRNPSAKAKYQKPLSGASARPQNRGKRFRKVDGGRSVAFLTVANLG